MFRGTTPTLKFKLPFAANELELFYITFSQNGIVILEKNKNECETNGNTITLKLTQEDTLSFSSQYKQCKNSVLNSSSDVLIQIRGRTNDGNVVTHTPISTTFDAILKEGVI